MFALPFLGAIVHSTNRMQYDHDKKWNSLTLTSKTLTMFLLEDVRFITKNFRMEEQLMVELVNKLMVRGRLNEVLRIHKET